MLVEGGDLQTLVKVTNRKLGISTYWTWQKFEEKLMQMKELYEVTDCFFLSPTISPLRVTRISCLLLPIRHINLQGGGDDDGGGGDDQDDTFYDPSDAWEKDDRVVDSPGLSPKL